VSAFEVLFLLLVLVALGVLGTAVALLVGGEPARAARVLRRLALGTAVYLGAVVALTALHPRPELRVGEPQCFDDWCITVVDARRLDDPGTYEVSLRLANRSRGTPMGEKGTVVYLIDARDRRYDPLPDPTAVPFDARLDPGQEVVTTRRFRVPPDAVDLGLVYTHEGGFPIGWLVLGEGGWFAAPPRVRLE